MFSHPVFYDIEHKLIIEKSDEMKASKAGGAPEGEVPDDHTAVEAPAQQELSRCSDVGILGEVGIQQTVHNPLEPGGPALQTNALLQGGFETLLDPCHCC